MHSAVCGHEHKGPQLGRTPRRDRGSGVIWGEGLCDPLKLPSSSPSHTHTHTHTHTHIQAAGSAWTRVLFTPLSGLDALSFAPGVLELAGMAASALGAWALAGGGAGAGAAVGAAAEAAVGAAAGAGAAAAGAGAAGAAAAGAAGRVAASGLLSWLGAGGLSGAGGVLGAGGVDLRWFRIFRCVCVRVGVHAGVGVGRYIHD